MLIFYPSSILRTAATSRSMLGKCSTEAPRHQDQVNLNPSSVTLNHFRGRRRHLVVREVPRSNRFLLPLQNVTDMADDQIYLWKYCYNRFILPRAWSVLGGCGWHSKTMPGHGRVSKWFPCFMFWQIGGGGPCDQKTDWACSFCSPQRTAFLHGLGTA